jgi:hypothetical protein
MLLAKSYTEYAIMAVTANEHNSSNCLNDISGNYGLLPDGNYLYTVDVNISYIANETENLHANCRTLSNTVTNIKSPLSIIVDVFVRHKDLNHPAGSSAPEITYHRRSLQKI